MSLSVAVNPVSAGRGASIPIGTLSAVTEPGPDSRRVAGLTTEEVAHSHLATSLRSDFRFDSFALLMRVLGPRSRRRVSPPILS